MPRRTEQQWEEMIAAFQAGASARAAAAIHGVSDVAMGYQLKKRGMSGRGRGRQVKSPLTDSRFGKLTVFEHVSYKGWRCVCDCGQETHIESFKLTDRHTSSCGKCERDDLEAAGVAKIAAREEAGLVLRYQRYRFRLRTTTRLERHFSQFEGCCRHVYNRALAIQNARRDQGQPRLTYFDLCKLLTTWRQDPETPWLADVPCHALQESLKALDYAFTRYFKRLSRYPVFKKKRTARCSVREGDVTAFSVDAERGRVRLPKTGWVRYFNSRPIMGTPTSVSVLRHCGKWHISIQVSREAPKPIHPQPGTAVGVDLGVSALATLSSGEQVPPLNSRRGIQRKLTRLQRSVSRKICLSSNWKKAQEKVARLHAKAANSRHDYLHKLTTRLSKNHALIVVEDLKVKNMSRSARGTIEKPGKNVRRKSRLNFAILDQGWGEVVRQLEYKAAWNGGRVVKVNPAFTSQTCHRCGLTHSGNRPTQSRFCCLWCGHEANADVNAAKVILAAGQAVIACGGSRSD